MKPIYSSLLLLFLLSTCKSPIKDEKQLFHADGTSKFYDQKLKPFYHGVASGDPLPSQVIIWTRVTPEYKGSVEVTWEVAEDKGFSSIIQSGQMVTDSTKDYTIKIDVDGLAPAKKYFYRFSALGNQSIIGETITSSNEMVDSLKFAFISCSNYEAGFFNAYAQIAEKELNAVIHLGDYIYEYAPMVYGDSTTGRFHIPAKEIVSLGDYRTRYAQYRLDKDLMKAHQKHPFITIWDDHEIANNAFKEGAENHQAEEGDYSKRKAAARKAYYEWLPIRESETLYRKFDFGSMANLLVLDERLERSQPADSLTASDFLDEKRSMLGVEQYKWLTRNLQESEAEWNLIGNQVIFADLNMSPVYPTRPRNLDSWDGYPLEKKKLISFLDSAKTENVVFLTGDTHSSWAFEVPTSVAEYGNSNVVALEFGTTSLTSSNSNEYASDDEVMMREKELLNPDFNPHLKYVNLRDHGYLMLKLTQEELNASWYYVSTVTEKSSEEKLAHQISVKKDLMKLQ